jgi:regulator of nonsense transcripts 2
MESLTKSVGSLAESLDITVPMLESAEAINAESSDGKGIELWSGGNETDGSDEKLGPFDDEETRRFYCNLPDLLSTKPPALLGISASDFSKTKERNLRVYGDHGGEEEDEEDEEIDLAAIEDMGDDAIMDETEEGDDNDEEVDDAADDGEKDGKGELHRSLVVEPHSIYCAHKLCPSIPITHWKME